jgi:hypothetical protein
MKTKIVPLALASFKNLNLGFRAVLAGYIEPSPELAMVKIWKDNKVVTCPLSPDQQCRFVISKFKPTP